MSDEQPSFCSSVTFLRGVPTDQFLIEPSLPDFTKFVAGGDSGSLVVDAQQHAIGLIFAGMAELPESLRAASETHTAAETDPAIVKPRRVESYGVANPISEVLIGSRSTCWFERVVLATARKSEAEP